MTDKYYTPAALANLLVGAARRRQPKLVADFAAGDGALLRAARSRWKSARLFGADIDAATGVALHQLTGSVTFQTCNFFSDDDTEQYLGSFSRLCDVILLNPPFSCRGNARFRVTIGNETSSGSKGLAFVARALRYLKPTGELLAIVPASCLTSERDNALLDLIRKSYDVKQIGTIERSSFSGCSVAIILLRITARRHQNNQATLTPKRLVPVAPYSVEILRGSCPVHRSFGHAGSIPLIHTTDLSGEAVVGRRWVNRPTRTIVGPTLLLPRVGRPNKEKVRVADLPVTAPSDCIIALKTVPRGYEPALRRLFELKWDEAAAAYNGSCAPYITLKQLQSILSSWGVFSNIVRSFAATPQPETDVKHAKAR